MLKNKSTFDSSPNPTHIKRKNASDSECNPGFIKPEQPVAAGPFKVELLAKAGVLEKPISRGQRLGQQSTPDIAITAALNWAVKDGCNLASVHSILSATWITHDAPEINRSPLANSHAVGLVLAFDLIDREQTDFQS